MPKMIQIRHVPNALHARLKSRAAMEGKSLSDYLLGELGRLAAEPSFDEWLARVRAHQPPAPRKPVPTARIVAIIRAARGKP